MHTTCMPLAIKFGNYNRLFFFFNAAPSLVVSPAIGQKKGKRLSFPGVLLPWACDPKGLQSRYFVQFAYFPLSKSTDYWNVRMPEYYLPLNKATLVFFPPQSDKMINTGPLSMPRVTQVMINQARYDILYLLGSQSYNISERFQSTNSQYSSERKARLQFVVSCFVLAREAEKSPVTAYSQLLKVSW